DLSLNPLFQAMFGWEEAAWNELELPGLSAHSVAVENETTRFALTLQMGETPTGELHHAMEDNTGRFEAAHIRRMVGHFEELRRSVGRDPAQRVSRLPLLRNEERQQLLCEWNETARGYETDVTVIELFERQVESTPEHVAVMFGEQRLSYRELNER